jgi:hypothetical protein
MGGVRLRTKFLIAMLLTSAGLTAVSLLIVQRTVENQVRRDLSNDLANSVETFRNAQKEREAVLARSAKLMADLPSLKALMTSRHPPTIQDASDEMFRLSGGDLFNVCIGKSKSRVRRERGVFWRVEFVLLVERSNSDRPAA